MKLKQQKIIELALADYNERLNSIAHSETIPREVREVCQEESEEVFTLRKFVKEFGIKFCS